MRHATNMLQLCRLDNQCYIVNFPHFLIVRLATFMQQLSRPYKLCAIVAFDKPSHRATCHQHESIVSPSQLVRDRCIFYSIAQFDMPQTCNNRVALISGGPSLQLPQPGTMRNPKNLLQQFATEKRSAIVKSSTPSNCAICYRYASPV